LRLNRKKNKKDEDERLTIYKTILILNENKSKSIKNKFSFKN